VVVTINGQASNGRAFTVIPPPTLTTAAPTSTIVGESVVLTGANFGGVKGTSTVKFNGTTATTTSWWDTGIIATVPVGATAGNIVVTVSNQASNGLPFTVANGGSIAGSITRATGGAGVPAATVQALRDGVLKGSTTTPSNGSYTITSLAAGTYTVRVVASGLSSELRQNVVVSASSVTTVNVPLYAPGTVGGKITAPDGVTPIAGAAVAVFSGPVLQGGANTNATGDYLIGALHPGTDTVVASNVGYRTVEQSVVVPENGTATKNINLDVAGAGTARYAYDGMGRLIQVIDPSGDSAVYRYDAVGNVTAIQRPGSTGVAISGVVPSSGLTGATATVFGTGFSSTPSQNTVTFNSVPATVTSATTMQLVVAVPAGATTGLVAVTAPNGSALSPQPFTVLSGSDAPPTIASFSPPVAVPGASVTITGTNFAPVPANNAALVNLAPLTVSTAAATSLTATIPVTAGSGPISVATQFGAVKTTSDLFVAPPPYVAADVEFTDRTTVGGSKIVNITTANRIGLVTFEAASGQHVSVTATASTIPSGVFKILGPGTSSLGSDFFWDGGTGFVDVFTGDAGVYTIFIDPDSTGTGAVTVTPASVPPDVTSAITIDGSPVSVSTTTPGQRVVLTFAGTAGQRVSLLPTNSTYSQGLYVSLRSAADVELFGAGGFIEGFLPYTGNYTILIDPFGITTGSVTATLSTVPADLSGTIVAGGSPVTVTIATAGQNAVLTFAGTASQRVSLLPTNNSFDVVLLGIRNPDGTWLRSPTALNGFVDTLILPTTGSYSIVVDPHMENTGSVTLTLYDVPSDPTTSLTIGGPAAGLTITTPGQKAVVTFDGTAGQQVTVHVTGSTVPSMSITIRVNGWHVITTSGGSGSFNLPTQTLPFSGPCTITFDPDGANVGSVTVSVTSP
jgi:YD repeat-containing protein